MKLAPRTKDTLTAMGSVIGIGLLVGFCLPGGLMLTVTPLDGDRPLAVLWLVPDERFTIRYNHSVEDAPIWETHSVDSHGRIYIE